jgi:hypothetical protein
MTKALLSKISKSDFLNLYHFCTISKRSIISLICHRNNLAISIKQNHERKDQSRQI